MKQLLSLLYSFEKRNNVSVSLEILSDGTCIIHDCDSMDIISEHDTPEDLLDELIEAKYKLDEFGRSVKPMVKVN